METKRLNCWEAMKCAREPGGAKTAELGVCPAATDGASDGINSGENGGRLCWSLVGTLCTGKVQGTFARKRVSCLACEFYRHVKKEEGKGFLMFKMFKPGQKYKPSK